MIRIHVIQSSCGSTIVSAAKSADDYLLHSSVITSLITMMITTSIDLAWLHLDLAWLAPNKLKGRTLLSSVLHVSWGLFYVCCSISVNCWMVHLLFCKSAEVYGCSLIAINCLTDKIKDERFYKSVDRGYSLYLCCWIISICTVNSELGILHPLHWLSIIFNNDKACTSVAYGFSIQTFNTKRGGFSIRTFNTKRGGANRFW